MEITAHRLHPLTAPKDSLTEAIRKSKLTIRENDIVVISSKVVSIDEGSAVPLSADKQKLIQSEADWYQKTPQFKYRKMFTIAKGVLVGSSGIDESNGSGHYILYPKDPTQSAKRLRRWLMKTYNVESLAVIISDSMSLPLRRGAVGFALAWDGIDPLRDYRGTKDIFGRTIQVEMANLIDSLAAAAVLEMGEGNEQTPIAVIRNAKNIVLRNRSSKSDQLVVSPEDDIFAPLLWNKKWKRGGGV